MQGIKAEQVAQLVEETEGTLEEPVNEVPESESMLQQAMQEIETMRAQALAEIEDARVQVIEEAKKAGYQEGFSQGKKEGYDKGHAQGLNSLDEGVAAGAA